jgi:hypothetical protein
MPIIRSKWLRHLDAKYIKRMIYRFMRSPADAAHQEYTMLYSRHDNPGKPTNELIDLVLLAASRAQTIDLSFLKERVKSAYPDPSEFPGEHYRLLAKEAH